MPKPTAKKSKRRAYWLNRPGFFYNLHARKEGHFLRGFCEEEWERLTGILLPEETVKRVKLWITVELAGGKK